MANLQIRAKLGLAYLPYSFATATAAATPFSV
jgi:hypothetical protein